MIANPGDRRPHNTEEVRMEIIRHLVNRTLQSEVSVSMKTLAIRLDDDLHAQLSVVAQLRDSSITDEIRTAIEAHLAASQHDEALSARAQAVLDDIERDAKARQAAIATLFGQTADQEKR